MSDLDQVERQAETLIRAHLGASSTWSFGFDHAKTRAGQCDFRLRKITVSRHLATRAGEEEIEQVLLHEIAHALCGAHAGHGPLWRRTARQLGYTGARLHDGEIASELAPWIGTCPAGHEHYRYRTPTRPLACARCSRRFSPENVIAWRRRTPATTSPASDPDREELEGARSRDDALA